MEIKVAEKQYKDLLEKFNEILSELKEINRKLPEPNTLPSYEHVPWCTCNDCNDGRVT